MKIVLIDSNMSGFERIFGLEGGSIFQGEQGLDQMAFMRPTPELARYATPVHGLYLCGAGTHPGGGVMAAPGARCAPGQILTALLTDLGLRLPRRVLTHRRCELPGRQP